jgi:hypothetical protein
MKQLEVMQCGSGSLNKLCCYSILQSSARAARMDDGLGILLTFGTNRKRKHIYVQLAL